MKSDERSALYEPLVGNVQKERIWGKPQNQKGGESVNNKLVIRSPSGKEHGDVTGPAVNDQSSYKDPTSIHISVALASTD